MTDNGRELAAILATSNLDDVADTVTKAFQTFDHDEGGVAITVGHSEFCPKRYSMSGDSCPCGYLTLKADLGDAMKVLDEVRAQLKRLGM